MSTAALLGLESSKSYQSLKQIQGTMRELFDIRASDQKSEEAFAKQEAVSAKRATQDAKRYEARQIKSAADYERAVKGGGGGGAAAGAGCKRPAAGCPAGQSTKSHSARPSAHGAGWARLSVLALGTDAVGPVWAHAPGQGSRAQLP